MKKLLITLFALAICLVSFGQTATKNYKIRSYCSINVPTTLELRDTPAVGGAQYCFWPGISSDKYARILVAIENNLGITEADLKEVSRDPYAQQELKKAFIAEMENSGYNISAINFQYSGVKIVSGKHAIVNKYIRPGLNGNVCVERYDFYISSVHIYITMSYRVSESGYWKEDFNKAINSQYFVKNLTII